MRLIVIVVAVRRRRLARGLLGLVGLGLGLAVAGCSATSAPKAFQGRGTTGAAPTQDDKELDEKGPDTTEPEEEPTSDEPTDTSGVTPTVPGAKGITAWRGHIDATPTVDFGGGKWCDYHVGLTGIELHVTLDPDGHIVSTDLDHTMTETATACDAQPLGVQQDKYSFRELTDKPLAALTVLQLPDPKNLPQANVTLTVQSIDAQRMKAHLFFQRTGGAEPVLNWTLSTDVELTPATAGSVAR